MCLTEMLRGRVHCVSLGSVTEQSPCTRVEKKSLLGEASPRGAEPSVQERVEESDRIALGSPPPLYMYICLHCYLSVLLSHVPHPC